MNAVNEGKILETFNDFIFFSENLSKNTMMKIKENTRKTSENFVRKLSRLVGRFEKFLINFVDRMFREVWQILSKFYAT